MAECVADPLRRDRILVVAGIADERPARTERRAEDVAHSAALEALYARRAVDALGEYGGKFERLAVVGLDVGLVSRGIGEGPADDEHRQAVVCPHSGKAAIGPDEDFSRITNQFWSVAHVTPYRVTAELARLGLPSRSRAAAAAAASTR